MNDGTWTPEIISRFWDNNGKKSHLQDICFSKQVGKGIIKFLTESSCVQSEPVILDFGCGPGFLLQHLLSQGLTCYGVDSSPEQVSLVNREFASLPTWKGASVAFAPPLPFSDASFDLIICVEVLEHLMPDLRKAILLEIFRLLKPKGRALFTTPNNEDLDSHMVYCPFCETSFHRRQHIHSLDTKTMQSILAVAGFDVLFCEPMNFSLFQTRHFDVSWLEWNLRFLIHSATLLKKYLGDVLVPRPFPHGRVFRTQAGCKPNAPHLCALVGKPCL